MSENWHRILVACAALAVLWIIVYWWWPASEPRIRFSPDPPQGEMVAEEAGVVSELPSRRVVEPPPIAVVPPQFREYTIQRGDTLEGIARRELGSARHVEAISRANPMTNLEPLRPGRVIKLPLDPGNIQGIPVEPAGARAAPEPEPGDMVEYIVRAGDTLSVIARNHYGSVRYADLIFEANRDQLPSRHQLQVGQRLRLPPKPD